MIDSVRALLEIGNRLLNTADRFSAPVVQVPPALLELLRDPDTRLADLLEQFPHVFEPSEPPPDPEPESDSAPQGTGMSRYSGSSSGSRRGGTPRTGSQTGIQTGAQTGIQTASTPRSDPPRQPQPAPRNVLSADPITIPTPAAIPTPRLDALNADPVSDPRSTPERGAANRPPSPLIAPSGTRTKYGAQANPPSAQEATNDTDLLNTSLGRILSNLDLTPTPRRFETPRVDPASHSQPARNPIHAADAQVDAQSTGSNTLAQPEQRSQGYSPIAAPSHMPQPFTETDSLVQTESRQTKNGLANVLRANPLHEPLQAPDAQPIPPTPAISAPDAESDSVSLSVTESRLASSIGGLANVLRANIKTNNKGGAQPVLIPPDVGESAHGTLSAVDAGAIPTPHTLTAPDAVGLDAVRPDMGSLDMESLVQHTPDVPGVPPPHVDFDRLMEQLADYLEFEYMRTYGTSGRMT